MNNYGVAGFENMPWSFYYRYRITNILFFRKTNKNRPYHYRLSILERNASNHILENNDSSSHQLQVKMYLAPERTRILNRIQFNYSRSQPNAHYKLLNTHGTEHIIVPFNASNYPFATSMHTRSGWVAGQLCSFAHTTSRERDAQL